MRLRLHECQRQQSHCDGNQQHPHVWRIGKPDDGDKWPGPGANPGRHSLRGLGRPKCTFVADWLDQKLRRQPLGAPSKRARIPALAIFLSSPPMNDDKLLLWLSVAVGALAAGYLVYLVYFIVRT